MTVKHVQTRRTSTTLTNITLGALVITTLAYASECVLLRQIDREIGIVVALLITACGLIATGWRWTPAAAALLTGTILIGNPWLLHNLAQPVTSGFFWAAATQAVGSVIVAVAGIGATLQQYGTKH